MAKKDKKTTKRVTKTGNVGGGHKKLLLSEEQYRQILDLASHMWSKDEIASFMKMSKDTLGERIKEDHGCTYEEFVMNANNVARGNLRSAMWRKAIGTNEVKAQDPETGKEKIIPATDGDKGTQIFLSKNYLGMTDKQDHTHKGDPVAPLRIEVIKFGSKKVEKK